jgi:acetyl-CoA carboxylase carboxyl transferase subunit alpha
MMMMLRTPIIGIVIGEGMSGGALAIGIGDRILMLEHSIYSVIAPEGCAAILWKDGSKGKVAAESLRMRAKDLHRLGVIDGVVPEPAGGAHRAPQKIAEALKGIIGKQILDLEAIGLEQLLSLRYEKFRKMGAFNEDKGKLE